MCTNPKTSVAFGDSCDEKMPLRFGSVAGTLTASDDGSTS